MLYQDVLNVFFVRNSFWKADIHCGQEIKN